MKFSSQTILIIGLLCFRDSLQTENAVRITLNNNGQFVDNLNRIRIFHGFNVVQKAFPWYDKQMLNATRLKLFKEWGFNIVRLGTMWTGVEPKENFYNETYIGIMEEIVKRFEQFGIYSLLDMHQDVLSSKFENYDGAPLWLIDKFPVPPLEFKFPFPFNPNKTYGWADYYVTYAASDAFQNLYTNDIGLFSWTKFWIKVATVFSKYKSIIGYELINEPWIGNFYKDIKLLLPGYAGRNNLLPAYDRLVEAIRKIDNNTLIFYEPVTYGAYYPSTGYLGTGFSRVPGGINQQNKSVLSYHYYCFFLSSLDPKANYPPWERALCDKFFARNLFKSAIKNVKETGGGLLLTEFGLCAPDNNPNSINTVECETVLEYTDEFMQSFTYWDSEFFDSDGNIQFSVVKSFSRTYPRALQGQPVKYSFNVANGTFYLLFKIDLQINAPTEIFVPLSVHYSKGFVNKTLPLMETSFDTENYILSVLPTRTISQGSLIMVQIDPVNPRI